MRSAMHSVGLALLVACSYADPPDVLEPELIAIHPSIARAGDTIMLEGTFSETTTVHFPGGAVERAMFRGLHRASVVVPAAATDGELSVRTANRNGVGAVAFRRATFGPALQEFHLVDAKLEVPRAFATVVVVKNAVYVLGGFNLKDRYLRSVERAPIEADGSLGPFTTLETGSLVKKRLDHSVTVLGNRLYLLGGTNEDTALEPSIESAAIDPNDGSLGPFNIYDSSLAQGRGGHSSVVIGNMLQVLGGAPDVEHAQITGSTLLGFGLADFRSASARISAASSVDGDSLCLLGGFDGVALASVACASIFPDGSFGELTVTSALGIPRAHSASIVVGRSLYLLGGFYSPNGSAARLDSVVRVTIDNGSVHEVTEPSLKYARVGPVGAVVGNSVCVIGGAADGEYLDTVECAAFEKRE